MGNVNIHGIVGFGFPGKEGEIGYTGKCTTFSEIKYKDEYEIRNGIQEVGENSTYRYEFVLDKSKYIETIDQHLYEDDQILVSGDGDTTLYSIVKDGTTFLVDDRQPINTINNTLLPEYQFNIYHALIEDVSSGTYQIKLYHSFTSDYYKKFNIYYSLCDDNNIEEKPYTNLKNFDDAITESTMTGITLTAGHKKNIHVFAYYRINMYKYRKIYITSILVST